MQKKKENKAQSDFGELFDLLKTDEEITDEEELEEEAEEEESTSEEEEEEEDEETSEEESTKEEETSVIAQMSETIGELKAQIAAMKESNKIETKPNPELTKPIEFEEAATFDPDDIEKHKDFFNKFGNSIAQKTQEQIIRSIVPTIQKQVIETVTTQSAVNEFWNANADLIKGKSVDEAEKIRQKVGKIANAIRAADPNKSIYEILADTTTIVRGGKPAAATKKKVTKAKPKTASKRKSDVSKKAKTTADQIDDLFS